MDSAWANAVSERARAYWTRERTRALPGDRRLLLPPAEAAPLLRALGLLHRDASIPPPQVRKFFQVISQDSRDWGAEVRYENSAALSGRTNRLTLGFQPAWLDMDNRQYQNLAGSHGELRKDQKDKAVGLAFYGENALAVAK